MLRHFMGLGGLMVVGALALGACGSDDKPEPEIPPDPYATFDKFCDQIAAVQCVGPIQEVCNLRNADAGAVCLDAVSSACRNQTLDVTRDVRSTSSYRRDRAEACVLTVATVYGKPKESAGVSSAEHATIVAACQPVFQGSATSGSECIDDQDCNDGLACYRQDLGAEKGQCRTRTLLTAKGDDCSAEGSICDKTLYCSPNDKLCVLRPADAGKECSATKPCVDTLTCGNLNEETGLGTCGFKKGSTEDCTKDSECTSGFCAKIGDKQQCTKQLDFEPNLACKSFGG